MGKRWCVTSQRVAGFAGIDTEDSTPMQGCVGYEVVLCAFLSLLAGVNSVDVLGPKDRYAFTSVRGKAF